MSAAEQRLDVVIPVLNEAHVLRRSVETVLPFLAENFELDYRLVIVDNGSSDGTLEVARELSLEHERVYLLHLKQRGRGRALRYAWTHSQADCACYMDVDLSTDLAELPPLVAAILDEGYDIAIGSRLQPESRVKRSLKRTVISRGYNLFLKAALSTRLSDAQCGFKAVNQRVIREIVPQVRDESWFFDTEMLALAERRGLRIKDLPVAWAEDDDSRVKIIRTAWDDIQGVFRLRRQFRAEQAETHSAAAAGAALKVLLVNPCQVDLVQKKGRIYARRWTPLDLATTAAVLEREGVRADIIDGNAETLGPEAVAARARGYDKIFVTSTSLDRWQCPHLDLGPFLKTVEALRPMADELYVLGSHGTVKPAEMLEETQATGIVRGEPETTVLELASGASPASVKGVTHRQNGEIVHNPEQTPVKLDSLPLPAFEKLPMERYSYEVLGDNFCLFEMSRGCASNCTFCLLETYGVGVRKKSVDHLAREVEHAVKNFGVKTAYFIDLEFTVLRKQALEFSDWLARQNYDFSWCCQTRFDLVNPEMLQKMKRAGCRLIHFGVEAGSDELLDWTNKKITMQQIEDGMRMVKEAGIESACFFIFGFPGAEQKELDDIYRFAVKLNPTYALFHVAAPYPGTPLYEQVKNDPKIRFSDDSLFPEAIEGPLTVQQLKRMTRSAYLRYYTRPSYVLSRLGKGEVRALWNQANLFWQFVRA